MLRALKQNLAFISVTVQDEHRNPAKETKIIFLNLCQIPIVFFQNRRNSEVPPTRKEGHSALVETSSGNLLEHICIYYSVV